MTIRKIIIALALAITPAIGMSQMLWTSAAFKAPAGKHWTFSAEADYRTHNKLKSTERWSVGVKAEYKYRQFKADAGYTYIDQRKLADRTDKGNYVPSYCIERHRAYLSTSVKLKVGHIDLSLRERYQFTHRMGKSVPKFSPDGSTRKNDKWIPSRDKHELRSRLQGEYTIRKKCPFKPFAAVEFYDNLTGAFNLEKIRFTIGSSYRINRHNEIELFYRYSHTDEADSDDRGHIIGVGYTFKL